MRAFVRLREVLATHKDLARKLEELEKKVSVHDQRITAVFEAIKELLEPGELPKRQQIGFRQGRTGIRDHLSEPALSEALQSPTAE